MIYNTTMVVSHVGKAETAYMKTYDMGCTPTTTKKTILPRRPSILEQVLNTLWPYGPTLHAGMHEQPQASTKDVVAIQAHTEYVNMCRKFKEDIHGDKRLSASSPHATVPCISISCQVHEILASTSSCIGCL